MEESRSADPEPEISLMNDPEEELAESGEDLYQSLFVSLIDYGYSPQQIDAILVMIDYDESITFSELLSMFPIYMNARDITNSIKSFYG